MLSLRGSLFLLTALSVAPVFGQTKPSVSSAQSDTLSVKKYTYTETMPVFPGGIQRFMSLLTEDLRYPPLALRDQTQGKVFLSYTIDPQGQLTNIHVSKGIRPDLDAEAVRLLQRLTPIRWQPGMQNGRPVTVKYTVPLTFSIGKSSAFSGDSLDANPGKALVFPLSSWPSSEKQIPADKGIIYGSCIQRLGFSSGGFGQYVRLINLDTHKAVRINVKPTFRSRRENGFCYALPPGRYALHSYEYTDSKWYGAAMHTEALRQAAATNSITDTRFVFTVQPGQVHYVGNWDFSLLNRPAFKNDKATFDSAVQSVYEHLPLAEALTTIPE